jgi:hypothetical protein
MSNTIPGPRPSLRGYVTTLASVLRRGPAQLELTLGFAPGSLKSGYLVYALDEPVRHTDFEWKDQTAYSDGWHFDPGINEYAQRQDELRAHLGKRNNYQEVATDKAIRQIMTSHVRRLNVRHGSERVVKVIPKGPVSAFPDSPMRGIPQWKLRVPKSFIWIADVGPGGMLT